MSKITEELLLKSMVDVMLAQQGLKKEAEARKATVTFGLTEAHFNTIAMEI